MANSGLQEDGIVFLPLQGVAGRRSVPQLAFLSAGGGFFTATSAVDEDLPYVPPPQLPAAFLAQPAAWDDGALGQQFQQGAQDDGLLLLPVARQGRGVPLLAHLQTGSSFLTALPAPTVFGLDEDRPPSIAAAVALVFASQPQGDDGDLPLFAWAVAQDFQYFEFVEPDTLAPQPLCENFDLVAHPGLDDDAGYPPFFASTVFSAQPARDDNELARAQAIDEDAGYPPLFVSPPFAGQPALADNEIGYPIALDEDVGPKIASLGFIWGIQPTGDDGDAPAPIPPGLTEDAGALPQQIGSAFKAQPCHYPADWVPQPLPKLWEDAGLRIPNIEALWQIQPSSTDIEFVPRGLDEDVGFRVSALSVAAFSIQPVRADSEIGLPLAIEEVFAFPPQLLRDSIIAPWTLGLDEEFVPAVVYGYALFSIEPQSTGGYLEGSTVLVTVTYWDAQGNALTPAVVSYQATDVLTGTVIVEPTALAPGFGNTVDIGPAQNVLVSNSRTVETHQAIFSITDPAGNGPFFARCLFDVVRFAPGEG